MRVAKVFLRGNCSLGRVCWPLCHHGLTKLLQSIPQFRPFQSCESLSCSLFHRNAVEVVCKLRRTSKSLGDFGLSLAFLSQCPQHAMG